MIHLNDKTVSGVYSSYAGGVDDLIDIQAVYKGLTLVWSKISTIISCYHNGYWVDEYPWTDNLCWRD